MTKEDYMKLSKERLAELLAERDMQVPMQTCPPQFPVGTPMCPYGGACTNKFRDCVNCPGVISDPNIHYSYRTSQPSTKE